MDTYMEMRKCGIAPNLNEKLKSNIRFIGDLADLKSCLRVINLYIYRPIRIKLLTQWQIGIQLAIHAFKHCNSVCVFTPRVYTLQVTQCFCYHLIM